MIGFFCNSLRVLLLLAVLAPLKITGQNYYRDNTFQSVKLKRNNATVSAIHQLPDEKLIIGGVFSYADEKEVLTPIRLNSDGTLDVDFKIEGSYNSNYIVDIDSDYNTLVKRLAVRNSKTYIDIVVIDEKGSEKDVIKTNLVSGSFYPNIVFQSDQKMLAGSVYLDENNEYKGMISRFNTDGSVDDSFSLNGFLAISLNRMLVQPDDKIILTGQFLFPGDIERTLIRIEKDGNIDTSFDAEMFSSSYIYDVCIQSDQKLLVGTKSQLIRLDTDGSLDETFNEFSKRIYQIEIQGSDSIIVVSQKDNITKVERLFHDGSVDEAFSPGEGDIDAFIEAMTVQKDGKVLLGGNFTNFLGRNQSGIVRLNRKDGSIDETFTTNLRQFGTLAGLDFQEDGKSIIFGRFNTVNDVCRNNIARLNLDGTVDESFDVGSGSYGTSDPNGSIVHDAKILPNDKVLVGGYFTSFNGSDVKSLIRLTPAGQLDYAFSTPEMEDFRVVSIDILSDDSFVIAGQDVIESKNKIIKFFQNGKVDSTFNSKIDILGQIQKVIVLPEDKILVGGYLSEFNGQSVNKIIRLNSDGSLDTTFTTDESIPSLEEFKLQTNGEILFYNSFKPTLGDMMPNQLFRLKENGNLDTTFQPNFGDNFYVVDFLPQSDGRMLVSGLFAHSYDAYQLFENGDYNEEFILTDSRDTSYTKLFQHENKIIVSLANMRLVQLMYDIEEQFIEVEAIATVHNSHKPFALNAISSSGLPLHYEVIEGPATIKDDTIFLTGDTGKVVIEVTQPGNNYYHSAPPQTIMFEVVDQVLSLDDVRKESILIYPNPFSSYINIQFKNQRDRKQINSIQLFDGFGKNIESDFINNSDGMTFDLSSLPAGIYILKIEFESDTFRHKIVKK